MSSQKRGSKPTALGIVKYWLSREGIERRNDLNNQYQTGENGKGFYFPCDIDYPHCFACNLPSHAWNRKLELCHVEPWCLGKNQNASNFILMCRTCHKDSPTVKNTKYFWKWVYNRQSSNERLYDNLISLVNDHQVQEYINECEKQDKNTLGCLWFDMFMLDGMNKLTEVILVSGELPLSSMAVLLADIVSIKEVDSVPSEVFTNDEIRELYLIYQRYAYEFEQNRQNGQFEDIFLTQLSKYVEIYKDRTASPMALQAKK